MRLELQSSDTLFISKEVSFFMLDRTNRKSSHIYSWSNKRGKKKNGIAFSGDTFFFNSHIRNRKTEWNISRKYFWSVFLLKKDFLIHFSAIVVWQHIVPERIYSITFTNIIVVFNKNWLFLFWLVFGVTLWCHFVVQFHHKQIVAVFIDTVLEIFFSPVEYWISE